MAVPSHHLIYPLSTYKKPQTPPDLLPVTTGGFGVLTPWSSFDVS